MLIFFMALTIYSYVRFRKLRYRYVYGVGYLSSDAENDQKRIFNGMVCVVGSHRRFYGLHLGI
jgi:hypothetical protein